jgi:uncharacterized protein YneF (UPF0154 family)
MLWIVLILAVFVIVGSWIRRQAEKARQEDKK